jgi:hypothetical protein
MLFRRLLRGIATGQRLSNASRPTGQRLKLVTHVNAGCLPFQRFRLTRAVAKWQVIPYCAHAMGTIDYSTNYWLDAKCAEAFWGQQDLPCYQLLLRDTVDEADP